MLDFVDDEFTAQDDIIAQPANACTVATIVATCITTAPNGTAGDGNLYIYLATSDGDIGVNGLETFSASVLPLAEGANAGKAALAEFDASATGSGWVERQSSALSLTATPGAGSWAFVLGHADYALAIGGIINIDDLPGTSGGPPTVGTISGAGSIFDADGAGNVIQGGTFTASSVSAGDAFGRVTFTVNSDDFSKLILDGYQISSSKIVLVETGDSFQGALAGIAYAQSVPTHSGVKGFVAADAQNTYVIGMQGADEGSFVLQSAEQLSIAADGSVTGFLDYADFSGVFEPASPDPVSAPAETVVVDPTGRVSIPGITDGADTPLTYNIQLYLDGNGHALALTLDPTDVQDGVGFQQSGASSIATSSFAGPYGMGITGWDADIDGEFDSVGPVVADGSSSFAGFGDVNWLDNFDPGPLLVWNNPVSGAFGTSTASGIFTGTITGIDILNCPVFSGGEGCTPDVFNFYLIDQYGDNIAIETDGMQLSFGYFAQQ